MLTVHMMHVMLSLMQLNISVVCRSVLLLCVISILLYFPSLCSFSYLTETPQMWYSVPQISQWERLQYSKLLLILRHVSKINPSERQEDMHLFQKRSAFVDL